jgi:diguanylate cyclase (GGDEF)-like protein
MHARITALGGGRYVLEDLGSRNGTFVGNARVETRVLVADDLVRLGSFTSLRFCLLDAVEQEFQRRLATAAIRDPLTGVFNRRQFDERLATEVGLAKRHARPLSLVMFDVDDFKSINDRHGHPVGDDVLRAVARALEAKGRREDEVFRYGGEEFALLARETGRDGAILLAERRLAELRGLALTTADGAPLRVRASAGVATMTADLAATTLIERADAALYAAKRSGKDRVCSAP